MLRRIATPAAGLAGLCLLLCLGELHAADAPRGKTGVAALTAADVRVTAVTAPADAKLVPATKLVDRSDGSRIVEVTLTNRSGHDLELTSAEITLPWVAPGGADFRVASGASATGRWPGTLVFNPARDKGEPVSGMYLLARHTGSSSLAGFVSWKTFWSKLHYRAGSLVATADGEQRLVRAGETVALEKIRLADGPDWQDLLFGYADAIARELGLKPKPPRALVGWSTWDYYGRDFPAAAVRGNLGATQQLLPNANLIQIDGGWWRHRGDYGGLREDLGADAMKVFATDIHAHGYTAGVHLDGYRFSPESDVAREHPEYFLHDERGRLLRESKRVNGQILHIFVDYSHPGACAYMRDALRRLRREWGYSYFKIDFLRSGIAEDVRHDAFGSDTSHRIVPHDRGLTSVERFHRAMAAFREGMGDDAWFVGCSTPFGPTFGYVDALRTAGDISPKFAAYQTQSQANAGNFYLHGKVAYADADYEVVRAREDQDATMVKDKNKDGGALALNEAEMWTAYVGLFSTTKIASDNLMMLRDERKELVRFAAARPVPTRFVPLDFWQHGRTRADPYQILLGESADGVFLALFNWNDATRTYTARGLPNPAALRGALMRGSAELAPADDSVRIALPGRHVAIFRLPPGARFDAIRRALSVE